MPRSKAHVPSYRLHRQSGQAIVTLRLPDGRRRDVLLGPYNSPASRVEYARQIAGYSPQAASATPPAATGGVAPADLTVSEVLAAFMAYARDHYRHADGTPTTELGNYRVLVKALRGWCGSEVAREFGPLRLKALRAKLVERGWCRTNVNSQVGRVRRIVKWAASEELVPPVVFDALRTVSGLQAGRSAAPERGPVKPVDDAVVAATLPFCTRHVAGLIRFQQATGCRPGEACSLRRAEIDTNNEGWVFRPGQHKGTWRGRDRAISIGPKGRALLAEFPTADPLAFVFSPSAAAAEAVQARAVARRTPRYPSHTRATATKRKTEPKRTPGPRYTVGSFGRAVARAVIRANRQRERDGLPPLPGWHPNRIRHAVGTEVRRTHGLEAAQAVLGHSRADVTQVYAERIQGLAERVASERG